MASSKRKKRQAEPALPGWFGAWHALSGRARTMLCAAVLFVVAIAFMGPIVFSGDALIGGDILQWSAMSRSLVEAELETGSKPLWATHPFGGMPAYMISYGNAIPQIDDLARVARNLFWPASHLLILFFGVFFLVKFVVRDRLSAVFAAVAFGLTTYLPILLVAGHNSKYVALAFAPWLLLAFAHALRRPSLLSGLLFAIALAVNVRAGHVQITYYALWVAGIWWIADGVSAVRNGLMPAFLKSSAWLALGSVLALLMVAQPFLAQWEYKAFTIRGAASGSTAGGMGWEYAMGWSQGVGEMLTLLIADAYGGSALYWGPKVFTAGPHYVGGIVCALALFAAVRVRTIPVVALSVAAVLLSLFALGENFEVLNRVMFEYFPLFDAFRAPETWLSIVALVLALLAAIGLREAVRGERDPEGARSRSMTLLGVFGGLAGVVLLLVVLGDAVMSFERPNEFERLAAQVAQQRPDLAARDPQVIQFLQEEIASRKADRADDFAGDATRTLFVLLLGGGLLFLADRRRIPGWAAQAGLILLVAFDLGGVGHRYLNADRLTPARIADEPIPEYDFDRFVVSAVEAAGGEGHFRALSLEGDPSQLARPAYYYETLGGNHGAKLRRFQDYLEHMLFDPDTGQLSVRALSLLSTRYVIGQRPPPDMVPVFSDDATGFSVYENPAVLPRAWFVDRVEVLPDAQAQWTRVLDPAFDPATAALVEESIDLPAAPRDSLSSPTVELNRFSAEQIAWNVDTDADRLLVVSEVYYPAGWTATVDGEPAPILAANYLLRGVVIPAGAHTVEMTFAPASHRIGTWIAGASTLLVYGLLIVLLGLQYRRSAIRKEGLPN